MVAHQPSWVFWKSYILGVAQQPCLLLGLGWRILFQPASEHVHGKYNINFLCIPYLEVFLGAWGGWHQNNTERSLGHSLWNRKIQLLLQILRITVELLLCQARKINSEIAAFNWVIMFCWLWIKSRMFYNKLLILYNQVWLYKSSLGVQYCVYTVYTVRTWLNTQSGLLDGGGNANSNWDQNWWYISCAVPTKISPSPLNNTQKDD